MRLAARIRDERGAFAVLYAIILVVMVGMAAITVDLGAVRADARQNQSVADFAATSAAIDLNPVFGGSPYEACMAAWGYFLANTPDAPAGATDPCGTFAGLPSCDPLAMIGEPVNPYEEVVAVANADPYQVTIVHPVPDGSQYMQNRLDTDIDAHACDRIAVRIQRTRGFVFGPVLDSNSGSSHAQAVARTATNKGQGEGVALVLLDPTGCKALIASGQATVRVDGKDGAPGVITLDSSGTETNSTQERNCRQQQTIQDFTVDAVGTQNSQIHALDGVDADGVVIPGVIFSYALKPGQGNQFAYEEVDVSNGRLSPRPVAGERVTRSPIDWRYNCSAANFCAFQDGRQPYVDQLRAQVGTTGVPAGFQVYGDDPGENCNVPSSASAIALVGDWFIDCTGPQGFSIAVPVTFSGGNVVFAGKVTVGGSTGLLSINAGSSTDRWVYFRAGGSLNKDAQSGIVLNRTFVYIDDGTISLGAGSGQLTWVSPEDGNFEDLALWSESALAHDLGGQANLQVVGTFFTPNAWPFSYTGQGDQTMEQAQFITWRMEVKGQGILTMIVDPERSTRIPLLGVRLIR